VVELPELRIVARLSPRHPVPRPPPTATAELVPCSDWEPLGPVFSAHEGEVPRERHVQRLCPGPSERGAHKFGHISLTRSPASR
jgi:hypothetical protein